MSRLHLFQKVANVVVYLFFLSATVYSLVGPSPDDDVILQGATYITPSYWIEYVWTLIHILLGVSLFINGSIKLMKLPFMVLDGTLLSLFFLALLG